MGQKTLKGMKRPEGAGRKAGTPNRQTQTIIEQCEAKGVNVLELMLEFVTTPCEAGLRLQALKELMKYIHPQRRAVDHSLEVKNIYLDLPVEELESMVKEKLIKNDG